MKSIANNGIEAVDAFLLAHEEGLPYEVKIVIISALNDEELILKLKKHGFDKYFTKPIKAEKVIDYIESL